MVFKVNHFSCFFSSALRPERIFFFCFPSHPRVEYDSVFSTRPRRAEPRKYARDSPAYNSKSRAPSSSEGRRGKPSPSQKEVLSGVSKGPRRSEEANISGVISIHGVVVLERPPQRLLRASPKSEILVKISPSGVVNTLHNTT